MRPVLVNIQSAPIAIESWSIETAPAPEGPWLKLMPIPGSPHLTFYIVGSSKNRPSGAFIFPDLVDAMSAPLQSKKEVRGWAMCECPSEPPCLGWYQRITLRDTQGKEYTQVLNLSDYNASLASDNVEKLQLHISKAPQRDLTHVAIVRPFPDAYRVDPGKEGEVAHLFKAVNRMERKDEQ